MGILNTLQANISYDIVDEFIGSYAAMCEDMERLILSLEKPSHYGVNVDKLFRIFHNIKSASGYMGLTRMCKAAEIVESVLEEARVITDGRASPELINWMLIANDIFNNWRKELEEDAADFSPIPATILRIPSRITI